MFEGHTPQVTGRATVTPGVLTEKSNPLKLETKTLSECFFHEQAR